MNQQKIIEKTEQYVLHTYNRFPVAVRRGEGVFVYDEEGKKYLDFMAGIAVYALGYHYPGYDEAIKACVETVLHTSNLYYHAPLAAAAEALVSSTGLSKAFFTNSGAEAVEGALKAAKKYAYLRDGHAGHRILAAQNSFHGRTVGALSVTGTDSYREPFYPLMDGVDFFRFNDFEDLASKVTEKTCAVILEPVQGEGGVVPASYDFMRKLRALCDEKDIVLILDEIQCGMGRTGTMWAYEQYDLAPDIMTTAKALGCGIPVGAFVLNEKLAASSLMPGDHGTTYGGNPLACTAVQTVFGLFQKGDIVEKAKAAGDVLAAKLEALAAGHPDAIREVRGCGLLRGLALSDDCRASEIAGAALVKGLLVITAGGNVLRLVPPLIISEKEIDVAVSVLDEILP